MVPSIFVPSLTLRAPSWSKFEELGHEGHCGHSSTTTSGTCSLSGPLPEASCRRIYWVTDGLARDQKFDPAILLAPSGVVV
jgi:hypothetical protein